MSQFQVKNLSFKYKNQKTTLIENFNMEVKKGEIVALIGPSGSGKSTILRLLSGLETPAAGVIKFNDHIVYDEKVNLEPQQRNIGMIFQDYALFPHLTVLKNVQFGIKGSSKERKAKAFEFLQMVEMTEHADKYPHQCSGGQQQRIAIARALAAEPKILLLDEPFSNLDAKLRAGVRREIRDVIKKANISAVLVTHDQADVTACADRMVHCLDASCHSECSLKEG
jgi:iron(III) transport system ATP-binding protein